MSNTFVRSNRFLYKNDANSSLFLKSPIYGTFVIANSARRQLHLLKVEAAHE